MERKFYIDSFERLLKEKSDEFRMYPARKVWHSIYNNIYPGRKYPSAVICILFITALPFVGFLNTKKQQQNTESRFTTNVGSFIKNISLSIPTTTIIGIQSNEIIKPVSVQSFVTGNNKKESNQTTQQLPVGRNINRFALNASHDKTIVASFNKEYVINNAHPSILEKNDAAIEDNSEIEKKIAAENYALQNELSSVKRGNKLALQVYASPSFIYGILLNQPSTPAAESQEINNLTNQNIGLEAGTAMQYSLSNILKVKAGLQFNYASYDIAMVSSPLAFNDALNNAYTLARATDLTNSGTPVTLHNEMYQFSLPVGLELKLLKHNKFQWNAGATIQPTYIAGGNAYLLSTDSHIDESALINRWNLNAGFETFITYKVDGVTWQLGPQFRYQFSSTYGKMYSGVDEKVAVFGVKIGVTKTLH